VVLNAGRVVADGSVREVASSAAAPREGRLRVPPLQRDAAVQALLTLDTVRTAAGTDVADEVTFALREGVSPGAGGAQVLSALTQAGLSVLSFELERARLADAFLAITAAAV
jgi:ABC-2 type transport system ATP-binding protein